MDSKWFTAQATLLGLLPKDVGEAIGRTRFVGRRILSGDRAIRFAEVKAFARLFQVSSMEIILHAGLWDGEPEQWLTIWSIWNQIPENERPKAKRSLEVFLPSRSAAADS